MQTGFKWFVRILFAKLKMYLYYSAVVKHYITYSSSK